MANEKPIEDTDKTWGQRENPQQTPHQHPSDQNPRHDKSQGSEQLGERPYVESESDRKPVQD
jgi:hypothetical protein